MKTFWELYDFAIRQALKDDFNSVAAGEGYDPGHLDCLLHPDKHPLVIRTGECLCGPDEQESCVARCPFGAIRKASAGGIEIDPELCVGCSDCIAGCQRENLAPNTDVYPALKAIRSSRESLAYALVAPAFLGQFGPSVTPGRLRSALKAAGFDGMIEVALFADILTLKEALEFDENIRQEGDYQLTSCCCPMWIGMIRKIYSQLVPRVPGSVSPMVACARTIKKLYPGALTVFIGPCLAKKAEAWEKDLAGDVDYVLTFQEVASIFRLLGIDPAAQEEDDKEHASRAGRIYARTGGVSEAVADTLARILPARVGDLQPLKVHGIPNCQRILEQAASGSLDANFVEGMACVGGCVGGPGRVVGVDISTQEVNRYGNSATAATPVENPQVYQLLTRLGLEMTSAVMLETSPAAQILSRCIQKPNE